MFIGRRETISGLHYIWGVSQGEYNFDNVFIVDKGIEDPNTAINGSSSARRRKWRFAGGPMMAQH